MFLNIFVAIMPLLTNIIVKYIESSSSKKDDEILKVVKLGSRYLSRKDNNDLSFNLNSDIQKIKVLK